MLNNWDRLKALTGNNPEVRVLVMQIESQLQFVANNVAVVKADSSHDYLLDTSLLRLRNTFGIVGEVNDDDDNS